MKPDKELLDLVRESKRCRSEAAAAAVSDRIRRRFQALRLPAGDLPMHWYHDPLVGSRKALRGRPETSGHACYEFARAIATLTRGQYETYTDREGHVRFEGACRQGGVDVTIEHLVWSYDHPDGVASRLPGLIRQYQ